MAGGQTPKTTESDKYYCAADIGVPFIRVQNLSAEGLQLNDCKYINDETHNGLLARSKVFEDDLLIKITGVGRMAISSVAPKGFEGNINQHMVVIKTKDLLTSQLIASFLNSDIGEKLASRRTTGGTRPALDYTALRSIPIILNEKAIEIMENAYTIKKQREEEANELLDSINDYLLGELGIEMPVIEENILDNRISYVASSDVIGSRFDPFYYKYIFIKNLENIKNGRYKFEPLITFTKEGLIKGKLPNDEQKNGNCKVIQINCMNMDGTIDTSNVITSKEIFSKKQLINKGDVLIAITGATIGKIGYWDYGGEYYLGGDIIKFNTGNEYYNIILSALLQSEPYQFQIKRCITGATNGHLSPNDISKFPIPIINDNDKQKEIANYIQKVRVKALQLREKTTYEINEAKKHIEKILLGEA